MSLRGDIRSIAVGPSFKEAMHFKIGQKLVRGNQTIERIKKNEDTGSIELYVRNDKNEVTLYKEYTKDVPVSIEYNIDF